MITKEQEKSIRDLLGKSLLDEDTLDDDEPWGEDGAMNAFERGQSFGAHDLAESILEILDGKE